MARYPTELSQPLVNGTNTIELIEQGSTALQQKGIVGGGLQGRITDASGYRLNLDAEQE